MMKVDFKKYAVIPCLLVVICCDEQRHETTPTTTNTDTVKPPDTLKVKQEPKPLYSGSQTIATGTTTRQQLLAFAESLIGTPYLYASTDPSKGFDCSGFITYVFNHFDIAVPRSSID